MGRKSKKRFNKIYCCDFETTSYNQYLLEGRTRVYLFQLKSLDGLNTYTGLSIEEWYKIVTENDIETIYCHNLSFDGTFIIHYLLEIGYKHNEDITALKEREFNSSIDITGSIYSITLKEKKKISIYCSYKLTGLSIKKLGKLVGVEKLDETHDYTELKKYKTLSEVPEEEIKYLTNDVEIQRLGLIKCFEMKIEGLTKSSACFKIWKSMAWHEYKKRVSGELDETTKNIVDASYRGGITMINKKYQDTILYNLRNYDVNSLYPSVMYNKMPVGAPFIAKNEDDIPKNYSARLYEIYVNKASIMEGFIPFIPTRTSFIWKTSYHYDEKIENMTLVLRDIEFDLFKMYYESDFDVVKVIGFQEQKDLFKEYIDKFRNMKENALNGSPEREFAKLCLNSLYGKFAQTGSRISKIPYLDNEGKMCFTQITTHGVEYDRKIASRITAFARCILIKAIEKNKNRFVYCDTDSIYLLGDYEADIPIDDKKFGYWKYEYSYTRFKGLKAKCYIAEIKGNGKLHSAVAGLPKDAQETCLSFENFKDGLTLDGVIKRLKRVKGGIVIVDTPFTIKVE